MQERMQKKLRERGIKAGNEGCSEDIKTRRHDYNQANGEAKRAIVKAKVIRGRGFVRR